MTEDHVAIVKQGRDAIARWRSDNPLVSFDLSFADLSGADLRRADLTGADLRRAELSGANLSRAELLRADLSGANLSGADLRGANLNGADLNGANLRRADLSGADLSGAVLSGVQLKETRFLQARCKFTHFTNMDLTTALDLDLMRFGGPSFIGVETLSASRGRISPKFLLGCGVPDWVISARRLFEPELTPNECSDLLSTEVFMSRVQKTVFFGGAFISYSHADRQFVDQLHGRLLNEGLPAWLDIHNAVAGPLGKQVTETIRSRDVVILVLSQHSLQSDWVWHEIDTARQKEQDESRYILCPITLDEAWSKPNGYGRKVQKSVEDHRVEIGYLKGNNILSFHESEPFDTQFSKLIRGIVRYYGRPADGAK